MAPPLGHFSRWAPCHRSWPPPVAPCVVCAHCTCGRAKAVCACMCGACGANAGRACGGGAQDTSTNTRTQARTHARTQKCTRQQEKQGFKSQPSVGAPRGAVHGLQVTPEFGLGQMRPHARAGSELAPRGCFLWYKEAHHKAPVHVRTRHARLMASSAKAGHLSETFTINFFSRTCGAERCRQRQR